MMLLTNTPLLSSYRLKYLPAMRIIVSAGYSFSISIFSCATYRDERSSALLNVISKDVQERFDSAAMAYMTL